MACIVTSRLLTMKNPLHVIHLIERHLNMTDCDICKSGKQQCGNHVKLMIACIVRELIGACSFKVLPYITFVSGKNWMVSLTDIDNTTPLN